MASYHRMVGVVVVLPATVTAARTSTPMTSVEAAMYWLVMVTELAFRQPAWRRVRSRTTSRAWERLRASGICGTWALMARGWLAFSEVGVELLTRAASAVVNLASAAAFEALFSWDFDGASLPLQAATDKVAASPIVDPQKARRESLTAHRLQSRSDISGLGEVGSGNFQTSQVTAGVLTSAGASRPSSPPSSRTPRRPLAVGSPPRTGPRSAPRRGSRPTPPGGPPASSGGWWRSAR